MIPRYTRPEMAQLWSDGNKYRTWLKVELAACAAMEARGTVPEGKARAVEPFLSSIDPARIDEIERVTKHDVIAFLTHVEELAGEPAKWLHLGMTSSDILDTATAMLLKEGCDLVLTEARKFRDVLRKRAEELKDVPMVGRTHGIHAEPTSCGLTFARWAAVMGRNIGRLERARDGISVGKIAGAVGNYGHLSPEVERHALDALGLKPETVATQVVQRDRHAEVMAAFALTAAAVEDMALTVRGWQRTEVGEAQEAFTKGQKGSSAMPHKKNPILSENLCGLARLVRTYLSATLENIALWHERDISHSSVERNTLPDASATLHFMLYRAARLISGLVINKERMAANLELTRGLLFSEAVLLALVEQGLMRQQAYELVQRCAMKVGRDGSLKEELLKDADVTSRLGPGEIEKLFDLKHHLRHVDAIFKRAFAG